MRINSVKKFSKVNIQEKAFKRKSIGEATMRGLSESVGAKDRPYSGSLVAQK